MSEDRLARMHRQMLEDLEKLGTDFQGEMQGFMDDLLKDALDPSRIMHFARSMGIDMSQFSQMFGRMAQAGTMPQGFDPYVVFHLNKSASEEEVKQAYRKVMGKVHPDKAGPELTFMATMANAAYEMIKRERGWQ